MMHFLPHDIVTLLYPRELIGVLSLCSSLQIWLVAAKLSLEKKVHP